MYKIVVLMNMNSVIHYNIKACILCPVKAFGPEYVPFFTNIIWYTCGGSIVIVNHDNNGTLLVAWFCTKSIPNFSYGTVVKLSKTLNFAYVISRTIISCTVISLYTCRYSEDWSSHSCRPCFDVTFLSMKHHCININAAALQARLTTLWAIDLNFHTELTY